MRVRNWSDVVLAAMIALCVNVAVESKGVRNPASAANAPAHQNVADEAQALVAAVLLESRPAPQSKLEVKDQSDLATGSTLQENAIGEAAQVAGQVASEFEMPFFSFGGNAAAE